MIDTIIYFDTPGKTNTLEALQVAKDYVMKKNLKKIVIASTTGTTALLAAEVFNEIAIDIIAVGLDSYGWSQDSIKQMEIKNARIKTVPCTHYLNEEAANTLRCFSQGVKVAFEIAIMAAYENLILENEEILVVAGSGFGSDTVIILKAKYKNDKKDFTLSKLLCLPISH